MTLPKRYTELHYMPNLKGERRRAGRPKKREYLHRIAYTHAMRGADETTPALLFIGAPFSLLCDVCIDLHKMMAGKVKKLTVGHEHSCRVKNGKHYWRNVVEIVGLDEQFISLPEFTLMFVSHMHRLCNCAVRRYKLETFLNL